jgi:hypothetical protein
MRPTAAPAVLTFAAICAGAAGCANMKSFESGQLAGPPDSPVAVAAREAQRNPGPWPTFSQIRSRETNSATPVRATTNEAAMLAQADQLRAQAAATPPTDPAAVEAFAAQQKAAVAAVPVPAESATAEIEAMAAAARARATPPPPPS